MADACGPRATLRAARVFASPCRSAPTQRNHGLRPDREPPRSSAAQFLTSVVVEVFLTGFIIPLTANPHAGLAADDFRRLADRRAPAEAVRRSGFCCSFLEEHDDTFHRRTLC